jgi:hypothetical protein
MTARHIDDQAEAFALRLLDERELAAGERHLAECERCRVAVREHEAISHLLVSALPDVELRPCLEEKVLAAFGAAVEQERLDALRPGGVPAPVPAGREPFWKKLFAPAPALAFAMVLAVAGLLTWGLVTNNRLQDREEALAQHEAAISAVAAGGRLVALGAVEPGAQGTAVLVVPATGGNPTFLVRDIPAPAGDRVYEIWLLRDGTPTPAGTFRPSEEVTTVPVPISAEGFDTVAITEEPAGGSLLPTGPVLLAGMIEPS